MHFCLDCNNNYDNNIAQSEHINANQIKCKQKEQFWNVLRFLVNGSTYIPFELYNIRQYSEFILNLWKYDINQMNNFRGSILILNVTTNEFFVLCLVNKRSILIYITFKNNEILWDNIKSLFFFYCHDTHEKYIRFIASIRF